MILKSVTCCRVNNPLKSNDCLCQVSINEKRINSVTRPNYTTFKSYYDENRVFPIEAILNHKQVVCMRRKMLFTIFQLSFLVPKIFNWWRHFLNQILIKYDKERYLSHVESRMFDSTYSNWLYNTSLTILLPWQQTGFQTSPILKTFLATFGIPFRYLLMVLHMHDLASILIY